MALLKKFNKYFIVFVLLASLPISCLAINYSHKSIKGLSQAYGFLVAQDYSLSRIEKEFPELSLDVALVRKEFNSEFPGAKEVIQNHLKLAMSNNAYKETMQPFQKINSLFSQNITKDIAIDFIKKVARRSKGEIESPVLEYLLLIKYSNNPVGEFIDGYKQHYQTDGAGKSRGIILNLQLPKSWSSQDGERPHIVKKWTSENGSGSEMIMLDIRNIGENITHKEIELLLNSSQIKSLPPPRFSYINSGKITLEGRPGYWIHMTGSRERMGIKLYQSSLIYQIFLHKKTIGINCITAGLESDQAQVDNKARRIAPLCKQVVNSLIINNLYQ